MKQLDYLLPPKFSGQGFFVWLQEIFGWADSRFAEIESILSGNNDSTLGKLATPPPALPNKPSIAWFHSMTVWMSERITALRDIMAPKDVAPAPQQVRLLPPHQEEVQR